MTGTLKVKGNVYKSATGSVYACARLSPGVSGSV